MTTQFLHAVYLCHDVLDQRWENLHRFLHPASLRNKKLAVLACFELDLSHHVFLTAFARDWKDGGNVHLSVRYDLVDSILELASQTSQLGFLGPEGLHDKPAADEGQ